MRRFQHTSRETNRTLDILGKVIPFLGLTLAFVHAKITFAVVRDILLQREEQRAHPGQKISPETRVAWQESHRADKGIAIGAWTVSIADLIILALLCVQGPIVTIFVSFISYLALFFFTYFFQRYEQRDLRSDKPVSQDRELASLRTGEKTSIIESWRMQTWELNPTEFRAQVHELSVDPQARLLSIKVRSTIDGSTLSRDRHAQYNFLHDVGELLLAMTHETWMQPYREYFSAIELEIWGERLNEDGHPVPLRVMRLRGSATRMTGMRRRGWDVMRLDRLFEVEFKNGEAV